MISSVGTTSGVTDGAQAAQFSAVALVTLTVALWRYEANRAFDASNRERTALALGLKPGEVTQPLSFEFNAVSAAI
jgi:hypothetical protein